MATTIGADPHAERAAAAAGTLLEAYHLQDQRERALLDEDPERAAVAGRRALERMAATYETEFPHVGRRRARRAGETFMRALFVQDEIENWNRLRRLPERHLRGVLVTDPRGRYGTDPAEDGRWGVVEGLLEEACREAGIDERYAAEQTRFWIAHGQCEPGWERLAADAHAIKLRAMVDDPPESVTSRMGRRFVSGVRLHDEWTHVDESADVAAVIDPVTDYYAELFALRPRGRMIRHG